MMSNKKILTVSYGTFSCTLEGFEDSFGTMKAIAEYFRDLAQDDRYFGAEPPQPDAEMLARVAERETTRRVEGHTQDGTVVLRATSAETSAEMDGLPQTLIASAAAAGAGAAMGGNPMDAASDSAAIAADVAHMDVINAPEETDEAAQLGELEGKEPPTSAEETVQEEVVPEATDALAPPAETAPSDTAMETEDDPQIALLTPLTPPAASDMDGTIAAKLQRIRDVVARNQSEGSSTYSEDEHAEDMIETTFEEMEASSATTAAFEEEDARALAAVDSALAEMDVDTNEAPLLADPQSNPSEEPELQDETDDADALALAAIDAAMAQTTEPDAPAEDDLSPESEAGEGKPTQPDLPPQLIPPELTDLPKSAPPVRVIKVKREDLRSAIDEGTLEDVDGSAKEAESAQTAAPQTEEDAGPEIETAPPARTLNAADEADLLRELAEVEAEISNATPAPHTVSLEDLEVSEPVAAPIHDHFEFEIARALAARSAAPSREDKKASKRQKAAEAGVEDSAMDRLMAEADTHMDDPEGSSRRAAFDHLRAAIVATRDDDALSAEATESTNDGEYREDLAEAVVPRRPTVSTKSYTGAERRSQPRPAPLKLVAEQRVDMPDARMGPVRPRRVSAEATASQTKAKEAESFADYAAEQGAHALPDLLEAAASYLSFVEGREQFSRPQLMTKVRQVGPKDFTREDGLRSFGQLLRAGKIEKIKGGRFTVSNEIGFRPGEQAAS